MDSSFPTNKLKGEQNPSLEESWGMDLITGHAQNTGKPNKEDRNPGLYIFISSTSPTQITESVIWHVH